MNKVFIKIESIFLLH